MNQSSLRYIGLVQAAVVAGFVAVFDFLELGEPFVAGLLLAAGGILAAGSVESVVVGPFELSWRGWYAGGLCLLAGGVVLSSVQSFRSVAGSEASLLLVAQSVVALSIVVHAWQVLRRPEALNLLSDVDRVVRLPP